MQKTKFISTKSLVAGAFTLLLGTQALATATADYWECYNVLGGEWNFGRAPSACNVSHKMDPALVSQEYSPVLFNDVGDRTAERSRYMTEMYSFIREAGTYYITKRNPSVSQAEIDGFLSGFYTLANQESYWSHYRNVGDGITRYMRGDSGHGHGLMQVDDRSHYAALVDGKGVRLMDNVIYGLDIYYTNWLASATASCITGKTDYKSRARASWAAYNGGASKLCRWANPNDTYAANDAAYLSKYNNRAWLSYVTSTTKAVGVDIPCLADGKTSCGAPATPSTDQVPVAGKLYLASTGQYCLYKDGAFSCVSESRDVACLEAREAKSLGTAEAMTAKLETASTLTALDRNALCPASIKNLVKVGGKVQTQLAISLRSTAGGALVGTLPSGVAYTVLDFEVRSYVTQDRYYKVKSDTLEGYFYAGNATDNATWAKEVAVSIGTPGLAQVGQTVQIVNAGGINMRKTPGGVLVLNVPKTTKVVVKAVLVQGDVSSVYYQVTYKTSTGYIYAGDISPRSTLATWATVVTTSTLAAESVQLTNTVASAPSVQGLVTVKAALTYRYLLSCAATTCAPTTTAARAPASASDQGDLLQVLEQNGDWVKVRQVSSGAEGYLKVSDVVGFVP